MEIIKSIIKKSPKQGSMSSFYKLQNIIYFMYSQQNKRSIFKLSGNMALGGNYPAPKMPDPPSYTAQQLSIAKNSLRLLKSRQPQKQTLSSHDYKRDYNESTSGYGGYQKYSAPEAPVDKYKQFKVENQFMNIGTNYKSRNNANNLYQISNPQQPEYPSYTKQTTKQVSQVRRKQNYSQNKYQEEDYKQKTNLPPRVRPGQQKNSAFQQKPISQVKRISGQNMPDEYESDVKLVECKAGCGRSFNPSVLRTHEKVCKKVFQSKRKQFNAQQQRIVESDQKKLQKKGVVAAKKVQEQKKANEKMPKWKAQSLQFRKIIQGNSNKPMNADQQKQYQDAQNALKEAQGYIKCPTCGRSFNQKAGTRHIPVCAEQAKKNKFKK